MEVGPLNLLFLPLLGGFLLYTRWNFVAFFAERCSGYRLLFTSATVGLLLLIAGRLAVLANNFLVIPYQASLVRWNHYAILSSTAITLVALLLLLIDCKRDRVLREEFRESPYKPIWGALLSVVLCVAFIVFSKLRPEIHIISPQMAVAICLLILVSGGVTLFSARFLRLLRLPNRGTGIFLRVNLLALMTAELSFLWFTTGDKLASYWQALVPLPHSGTPFLAFAVGAVSWWPLNLLMRKDAAAARLHRDRKTSTLEQFLYFAGIEKAIVQLSLRDGKVYVGWIEHLPPHPGAPDSFVNILPVRSGFRDRRTKEIQFTTDYSRYYISHTSDSASKPEGKLLDIRALTKLVPIANIYSASRFDPKVYEELAKDRSKPPQGSVQSDASPNPSSPATSSTTSSPRGTGVLPINTDLPSAAQARTLAQRAQGVILSWRRKRRTDQE